MALDSNLAITRGLLWEVSNRMPFKVSESPEFIFLNTIWKAEIDLMSDRDRSTSDIMVNIILHNLSEIHPSEPFEVSTFLEDKKNNVQMRCSKITVSSRDETLFKISFYALCKKLPGFNMCNDLTVLFVFSASTNMGLNLRRDISSSQLGIMTEKMDEVQKPCLSIVQCLIWSSEMPRMHQSQTSPVFYLLNSEWKLEILLANSQTAFHSAYQISLKNTNAVLPPSAIEVKHFLDHKEYNVQYKISKPDFATVSSDVVSRVRYDSIIPDAQGFEHCNDITVISIFNPSTGLGLTEMPKRITSGLLDCSLCQNRGCFTQDNLNRSSFDSQYPCTKFLSHLHYLADDMIMLLDKSFMSDVQLKCGVTFIPAHRAILAARSHVFMSKISVNNDNNKNTIIDVSDVDLSTLRILLRYIYTGIISDKLTEDSVYNLYIASTKYAIPSLRKMCRCYISRNFNENNYFGYTILALAHNDSELKNAVSLFVIMNPLLRQSDSWPRFSREFPHVVDEIDDMLQTKRISR